MATAKKPIKKTITPKPTTEDLLLGNELKPIVEDVIDYESPERLYKVTNLELNNKPIKVRGDLIETFIGGKNAEARKELKNGVTKVITKDAYKGSDLYKIEVVK